tara:strand:- start:2425 stop:2979 length:555 start_codon:yes stop_codon:yes gene_type:complete
MASFLSKVKNKARNRKVNFSSKAATDAEKNKTKQYLQSYNKASDQVEKRLGINLPKIDNLDEYSSSIANITNVLPENQLADLDLGIGINQQSLNIAPKDKTYVDNVTIKRFKSGPTQLSAQKTLYSDDDANIKISGRANTQGDFNAGLQASLKFKEGGSVKRKKNKMQKKPRGWGCAKMSTRGR